MASEPTLQDVLDRLDKIDSHVESLCTRVTTLERTMSRKFAAMGAGFRMMADQMTDS